MRPRKRVAASPSIIVEARNQRSCHRFVEASRDSTNKLPSAPHQMWAACLPHLLPNVLPLSRRALFSGRLQQRVRRPLIQAALLAKTLFNLGGMPCNTARPASVSCSSAISTKDKEMAFAISGMTRGCDKACSRNAKIFGANLTLFRTTSSRTALPKAPT
jgi:hypothetical protein